MFIEVDFTRIESVGFYQLSSWLSEIREMKSLAKREGHLEATRACEIMEGILMQEVEYRKMEGLRNAK